MPGAHPESTGGPRRLRIADCVSAVALTVAAVGFIAIWERASEIPQATRAFDTYEYCFPNILYAVKTLQNGGRGFFWNALNNCGQPFFGISSTAALYPANAFFLWLEPGRALLAFLAFNLSVAAVSAYGLGRVLGLGTLGALSTGLAFAFGNANVDLVTWSPLVDSAYVWLPAVMLCCELILQDPRPRRAVALAIVLGIALLAGFPQQILYVGQLILLRLAWAVVTRETSRPVKSLLTVGAGLTLGILCTAWALVPGVEAARLSVRGHSLGRYEVMPQAFVTMGDLRRQLTMRSDIYNLFRVAPWTLCTASLLRTKTRRVGLFYLLAGLVFFDLGFGLNGHVYPLYQHLPAGTLFRDPGRAFWITALCLAVLVGLGVDAYTSRDAEARPRIRRALLVAAPLAGLAGFHFFALNGIFRKEWWVADGILAAVLVALVPRLRSVSGAMLAATLVVDLIVIRPAPFRRLLPDWNVMRAHADVFTWLREQRTPQERVYTIGKHEDYSLMPKTPALFGIPSMFDYEPQPSLRWAEFYVLLRAGKLLTSLNDFYYCYPTPYLKWRLLDLTASRYVVAGVPEAEMYGLSSPPLRPVMQGNGARVYVNPSALPRARYVPRLLVVPDPAELLTRLAVGPEDPQTLALVETPPASGFVGDPTPTDSGTVTFAGDEPEHVVLDVVAPRRGFVVLADQEFPGWRATVNGTPAEIIRANYVFRAVEVPAGSSVVDFRYRPASVRIGWWLSAVTILGLLAGAFVVRRRGKPHRLTGRTRSAASTDSR